MTESVVAVPAGFSAEDVACAWECVKDAVKPRLQIEVPTSTVQMEYTYHIKAEKMIEKIGTLTAEAKKYCNDVEFAALDATRADVDFLINAAKTAVENGAGIVTVCDTAGTALPAEIAELVKKVKEAVDAPVYVQVSDRLGMAVAAAVAAADAGADGLKCSMAGGDALSSAKICDAISARSD